MSDSKSEGKTDTKSELKTIDAKATDAKAPTKPNDDVTEEEEAAMRDLKMALAAAKIEYPFNDRGLWAFLFARKCNIERSVEVVKNYVTLRAKHKLEYPIRLSSLDKHLLEANYTFFPETFDNEGRAIVYIILRNFDKPQTAEQMLRFTFYWFERWQQTLPLSAFRAGTVYIEDLAGVGWKHFRALSASKEANESIQNAFPLRIRQIYILNPGWIFRTLIKLAKLFVKAKVISRTQAVTSESLLEQVPRDRVITDFGGDVKWDVKAYLARIAAEEAKEDEGKAGAGAGAGTTTDGKTEHTGEGKAEAKTKAAGAASTGTGEGEAPKTAAAAAAAAVAASKAAKAVAAEPKG